MTRKSMKNFKIGDLVWNTTFPVDAKTRGFEKWSPNWKGPFVLSFFSSNNAYLIQDIGSSN